jgi:hypothetical protein
MQIRFRQGLIALPPNSIQLNENGGVDIVIDKRPILATAASGSANYTISETRSVQNAWGPFSGNNTQYLYWEIDRRTGTYRREVSPYRFVTGNTAPTPVIGQLWWDITTNRMKRWNGSVWEVVLIVFAATISSGGILQSEPIGSQVGIYAAPGEPGFSTGYILHDGLGGALKTSDMSEFLTSETPLTSIDTGSLVKLEGSQLVAVANNSLAAFDAVYMIGDSLVDKASGFGLDTDSSKAPIGIVTTAAVKNEPIEVVTAGKIVVNEQWNWGQSDIGKPVYCDNVGQITITKPRSYKNVRVGIITSNNSVLLTFDWETDVTSVTGSSGIQQISVNAPITNTGVSSAPIIGITRASETSDGYLHHDDFNRIVLLENQKANVIHTHTISDISGLQAALDAKLEASALTGYATETYVNNAIANITPSSGASSPVLNIIALSNGFSQLGTGDNQYYNSWTVESYWYNNSSDTSTIELDSASDPSSGLTLKIKKEGVYRFTIRVTLRTINGFRGNLWPSGMYMYGIFLSAEITNPDNDQGRDKTKHFLNVPDNLIYEFFDGMTWTDTRSLVVDSLTILHDPSEDNPYIVSIAPWLGINRFAYRDYVRPNVRVLDDQSTSLPTANPGDPITIQGYDIYHNGLAVFSKVSGKSATYMYDQNYGVFNEVSSTVLNEMLYVEYGTYGDTWMQFDGTKWNPVNRFKWKVDICCERLPLERNV